MSKHLTEKQIAYIREQVRNGKKKSEIAMELRISRDTVYNHTRDLSRRRYQKPSIHGTTLELMQEILRNGFIYTGEHRNKLRFLQRLFPVIKRSQFKNRSIYYLEDKNKIALWEMMKQDTSRIISYQELSRMSSFFQYYYWLLSSHHIFLLPPYK